MQALTDANLTRLKSLFGKKAVIVTHYNPDGDAIGSALAWQLFLKNQFIPSSVIVPNDFPKFLKWLPFAKEIVNFAFQPKLVERIIAEAEVIYCLDFNSLDRTHGLAESIKKSKAFKVLIDHHQMPDAFDLMFSDTNEPATCQMIFKIIQALDPTFKFVNKEVADCIFTGLMTDTGGFRHDNVSAETYIIASKLIDKGAVPHEIFSKVFDSNTPQRLKLLSKTLETMEILPEINTVILKLSKEEQLQYGCEKGDTEGFVNYGLSIEGIKLSVFIKEDTEQNLIKLSLRSKAPIDVNQISRELFQGGGHIRAAGGKSHLPFDEAVEDVKKRLYAYFA